MGRRWKRERARLFADAAGTATRAPRRTPREQRTRRRRDAARPRRLGSRARWGLLAAAVVAALLLSSLRVQIFRLRYALGSAHAQEAGLIERKRALEVDVARLRDPRRLRRLAAQRGFVVPERVIEIAAPESGAGERP